MPQFDPTAIFQALRMKNIFNPTRDPGQIDPRVNIFTGEGTYSGQPMPRGMQQSPVFQQPVQQPIDVGFDRPTRQMWESPTNDPIARMRELYQPDTRATDRLYQLLDQIPERNKPGILRKIAASVAGMGTAGPKAADQMLYGPYYQQMQDFEARFKPTEAVAQQERLQNTNLRQIASSVLQEETRREREERLAREFVQREERLKEASETRAQLDRDKLALAQWKAKNQNGRLVEGEDGFVYLIDPLTGEEKKTNVKHGSLSDIDKINLGLESALTRISAQGAETRRSQATLESQRQTNRERLLQQREAIRKERLTEDKRLSVSQDAAAWKLARQQYIADNPTHADFWDDVTGLPSRAAENDDTGEYQDAVDEIRDRYNRIKERATPTIKGNVAPKGTPPIRTIRIKNDKTGQTATMPENKPVPNGWKKVGYVE